MHRLALVSGPRAGETVDIDARKEIGRRDADITLDDSEVSRRHAVVWPAEGGLAVEDLGSLNGTWVDGVRIDSEVVLHGGERLRCGSTTAEVIVERPPAEPVDRTEVAGAAVVAPPQETVAASRPRAPVAPQPPAPPPEPPREPVRAPLRPPADRPPRPAPAAPGWQPPAGARPRHAASLLWTPTILSLAVIVATALAEVVYFATR